MLNLENINLRPIEKTDICRIIKWKNDYEVFKYLGGGYEPQSMTNLEKYIDILCDNSKNNKRFIIDNNGNAIGIIGLYEIDFKNRNCELGIYIGEKKEWGKGYASTACKLIQEYAFSNLNLKKIKLKVVEENISAKKMYMKLGYRLVGTYINERYIEGKYNNIISMELLRGENNEYINN